MPLSAYGSLPEIEDAAISPDGRHIAVVATLPDGRAIIVTEADLKPRRIFPIQDLKLRGISWAGNDHVLVQTGKTQALWGFAAEKYEFTATAIVPVAPKEPVEFVFANRSNLVSATFGSYGVRQIGGKWYAYFGALVLKKQDSEWIFDHGRPYLYRVEIAGNRPELVERPGGEGTYRDWLVARDGTVAATLTLNSSNGEWSLRGAEDHVIATGRAPSGDINLVALGKDSDTAIYSARDEDGGSTWYEVPLAGGTPKPYLADVEVDRLYTDPAGGNVIGYWTAGETAHPVMFFPPQQSAATKISRAFAKLDMRLIDFTGDLAGAIVRTSGNRDSGTWFMVDVPRLKADPIGNERGAIGPEQVGPISTLTYKAGDGLELDGILTLPPGREAKGLPVVMLPHGGPASSDRARFDWWAQAFASRGYAVFQPNFRGSTNRDDAFRRAGRGEWGGKMQTDISDGLAALAAKGIVDPKRACIVGASYGGYAALAGVTLQQGLYRCAVSVAGVSDLNDMYREDYRESGETRITKAALLEQLGPRDRWADRSPRRLAARADAPVLLIHGKDDTVVPYTHTARMADALKDAHRSYEVVTLPGEDHWLSRAATRMQMLEAAVAFVEKHNPAD